MKTGRIKPLQLQIRSVSEALSNWSEFQREAVLPPYQQTDWLHSWQATVGAARNADAFVVEGHHDGQLVMLLPLKVERIAGVRTCRWLGGKTQNLNGGLFEPRWLSAATPNDARQILHRIARLQSGIDIFHFEKQPGAFQGLPNPFAGIGIVTTHADPLYAATMEDDFESWERQRRSRTSRNRLRRKNKKLASALGPVTTMHALSEQQISDVLDVFFAQRKNMQDIGRVPNPFSDPSMQAFLHTAAGRSAGQDNGLHLFALIAGGRICAVSMALRQGTRHSGFAISMDERAAEFSPGKLLEREVLRFQHARGVRCIDFGLGDEAYKREWADRMTLRDALLPITLKGWLLGGCLWIANTAKRNLKSYPAARQILRTIRMHLLRQV